MNSINNRIMLFLICYVFTNAIHVNRPACLSAADFRADQYAEKDPIKITILYDNYVFAEGTQADWGFSCLIENTEKTILFDTGSDPDILMHNVGALKKDLSQIDVVVISHNHGDHTGGLSKVVQKTEHSDVYLPNSTPLEYMEKLEDAGVMVLWKKDFSQICKDAYLTGELGDNIREQSLILDTENGLVVITGCSHPGIVHIVRTVSNLFRKDIYMVLGGFHLLQHSKEHIREIIKEVKDLGVQKCGPTHCTGDEAIQLFKSSFGDDFIQLGTGQIIDMLPK